MQIYFDYYAITSPPLSKVVSTLESHLNNFVLQGVENRIACVNLLDDDNQKSVNPPLELSFSPWYL